MSTWRRVLTQIRGRLVTPPPIHLLRRVGQPPVTPAPPSLPPYPPPLSYDEIDDELNHIVRVMKEDDPTFTWAALIETLEDQVKRDTAVVRQHEIDLASLHSYASDFLR